MTPYQPLSIIGFHSCDREVGLKVLNGLEELMPSTNTWDWLGSGIYFWEQNPYRAWEYAAENASNLQFNKKRIKTPFVIGAIIELGNCFNLVESASLKILSESYIGLQKLMGDAGKAMPKNNGKNRALDCAVIKYINESNAELGVPAYDTVRCAFSEGEEVYPGSTITSRLHIQICVQNTSCIKGFFLPRPIELFNPLYKIK